MNQNEGTAVKQNEWMDGKKEGRAEVDVAAEVLSPKSFLTASHSSLHSIADNDSSATLSADEGSHADDVNSHRETLHPHGERHRQHSESHASRTDDRRPPQQQQQDGKTSQADPGKPLATDSAEAVGEASHSALLPNEGISLISSDADFRRNLNLSIAETGLRISETSKPVLMSGLSGAVHPGFEVANSDVMGFGKGGMPRVRDLIRGAIKQNLRDRSSSPPSKSSMQ